MTGRPKPTERRSFSPKGPPHTAILRAPPEPVFLGGGDVVHFIFATKKTKKTKTVIKPQNTWKSATPTRVSLSQKKSPKTLYQLRITAPLGRCWGSGSGSGERTEGRCPGPPARQSRGRQGFLYGAGPLGLHPASWSSDAKKFDCSGKLTVGLTGTGPRG